MDVSERRRRAARLAPARRDLGMTQGEVAAASGVSKRAYQDIELGKRVPQADSLLALERTLGIDYGEGQAPDLNLVDPAIYPLLVAVAANLEVSDLGRRGRVMAAIVRAIAETQ